MIQFDIDHHRVHAPIVSFDEPPALSFQQQATPWQRIEPWL